MVDLETLTAFFLIRHLPFLPGLLDTITIPDLAGFSSSHFFSPQQHGWNTVTKHDMTYDEPR
jgi:hypothetical protein